MNLKNILLISAILVIFNISFVFAETYKIDLNNDGIIEKELTNINDLKWVFFFQSYGAESGSNLPTLTVTGQAPFTPFSVDIPSLAYTCYGEGYCFGHYHASWGWASTDRCIPSDCHENAIENRIYPFEHFWSSTEITAKRSVESGVYDMNLVAYGNGLNPSGIEPVPSSWWLLWQGKSCPTVPANPLLSEGFVACRHPPCPHSNENPGYYEYIEYDLGYCQDAIGGVTKCPECNDNRNDCTEYDENNGYLCNGVNAIVEFYDGNDPAVVYRASMADFIEAGDISYNRYGFTFLTDDTPQAIDITKSINIIKGCTGVGDCIDNVCYEPNCVASECIENAIGASLPDPGECEGLTGCVLGIGSDCVCDGAGTCVECTQASDCGDDGLVNEFQCNEDIIEQKYLTYSCGDVAANTCGVVESWVPGKDCTDTSQVCSNPQTDDDCCSPFCGSETPYRCESDGCKSVCGVCPEGKVCNDHMCDDTGNAYWANMNGEKVGVGVLGKENFQIGDTVLLIYRDRETESHDFVIWEKDGPLITFDTQVRTIPAIETFDYNGHLAAKWVITQEDFDRESDGIFGSKDAKFYFRVNPEGSNELLVDEDDFDNSKPQIRIIDPILRSKVMVGDDVDFTQISGDEDDDLKVKWTFENGVESVWFENCLTDLTNNNCNTTHAYTSSGTKIIEIIAKEMTRTQEAINNSKVFVYGLGVNVFADILEPPFGKIYVSEADGSAAQLIPFDASITYIANCNNTQAECELVADEFEGPSATKYCFDLSNASTDLWCYDFPGLEDPKGEGKYRLFMNWAFSENIGRTGIWTGDLGDDYDTVIEFQRMFFAPIQHWAKLEVDYTPLFTI